MFCITPQLEKALREKFLSGELTFDKIANAKTTEERRALFSFMGEQTSIKFNEAVESQLLKPNQQRALNTFFQQKLKLKPEAQRDMVSRIMKQERLLKPKELESFMSDAVAAKYGDRTTQEQAGKIFDLANTTNEKFKAIPEDAPKGSPERMEYGTALAVLKQYLGAIKTNDFSFLEKTKWYFKNPLEAFNDLTGLTKSLVANLNNHVFGRQGWRTLFDKPDIWISNFKKSWGYMQDELKGIDAMTPIKAEIWSRPNSINGLYRIHKVDVDIESEEEFPSHGPAALARTKIQPFQFLGRVFRASETAFQGSLLRIRADWADALFDEAEKNNVNIYDPETNIGVLANSITARGKLAGLSPKVQKGINCALFSVKYLKSQLDALGAIPDYVINKIVGESENPANFAKRRAAQNVLKTVAGIASVLTVAKLLDKDSVETDPRSAKFGKICIGPDHEIGLDVTAGLGALSTAAARMIPSLHDGKMGCWYKKADGTYINLLENNYGQAHWTDIPIDFLEGRASPLLGAIINYVNQRDAEETTTGRILKTVIPMLGQSMWDLSKDKKNPDLFLKGLVSVAGFMGVHDIVRQEFSWDVSRSKELKQFKETIGDEKFQQANDDYDKQVDEYMKSIKNDDDFQKMSDEDKEAEIKKKRIDIKNDIFDQYNFTYERGAK